MISFELTDEQRRWQAKARDFAEAEIRPLAWKIDKGLIKEYPWPLMAKLAQAGLLCLGVPREYGGSGLDVLTTAVIVEELAAADPGIAFTVTLNSFPALLAAGTEVQKKKFLPRLCDPERPGLSAFALTEPNAGSDAASLAATARREGGEYILNGEKCFISNGDLASLYTVFATLDRTKGFGGITAFLVPAETPGLQRGKTEDKMGFRSSHTGVFALDQVRIPEENRLGEEGAGFGVAMKVLDVLRILSCGAVGVGLARGAFEATLRFLTGRSPAKALLGQQAVSFELADMLAAIEAARLMVWKSGWLIDSGRPVGTMSSLTKFLASDLALEVAQKGLRLVGPPAYSEEFPLEKLVRDAKLLQIYEGTNQISRLVAARGILAA